MTKPPPWAKKTWFRVLAYRAPGSASTMLVGQYKTREKAETIIAEHKAAGIEAWLVECHRLNLEMGE